MSTTSHPEPQAVRLPFTGRPEATCPYCGADEGRASMLANNHGPDSARSKRTGMCMAMDLTRSHVIYDARQLVKARSAATDSSLKGRARKAAGRDLAQATTRLEVSIARAHEVWPNPTWLADTLHAELDTPLEIS